MFICEKNYSCCDFQYWDSQKDVEPEAKECGHLTEVIPVKRGKWILHKNGDATCDQCHRWQKDIWDFDTWQNFCGHCGADMRGE